VNIFTELITLRLPADGRRVVIHADDATPHTDPKCRVFFEENRFRLAVHPPYSPGLTPPNFFLFEHIKHSLQGITFPSPEELLAAIQEIVGTSRNQPWKMCFGAGWRDPNGFLRTMVTTTYRLNTG
jgi:transposase